MWSYPEPQREAERIRDHLAFFNERVDIEVDGELAGAAGHAVVAPLGDEESLHGEQRVGRRRGDAVRAAVEHLHPVERPDRALALA